MDTYYKYADIVNKDTNKAVVFLYAVAMATIKVDSWLNSFIGVGGNLRTANANEKTIVTTAIAKTKDVISVDRDDLYQAIANIADAKSKIFAMPEKPNADMSVADLISKPKNMQVFTDLLETDKEFYIAVYIDVVTELQRKK